MRELERAVERVRFALSRAELLGAAMTAGNALVAVSDLRLLLSALEWRPIAEYDRERDGWFVIVADNEGSRGEAWLTERDGWFWANTDPSDYHDGRVNNPTHFRPLPPPPKDDRHGD